MPEDSTKIAEPTLGPQAVVLEPPVAAQPVASVAAVPTMLPAASISPAVAQAPPAQATQGTSAGEPSRGGGPATLRVPSLPPGKAESSGQEGVVIVVDESGGRRAYREEEGGGYVQLSPAGEGGEAFIPTEPSPELVAAIEEANKLPPEQRFEKLKDIGIVPKGSAYDPSGEAQGEVRYLTPSFLKAHYAVGGQFYAKESVDRLPAKAKAAFLGGGPAALSFAGLSTEAARKKALDLGLILEGEGIVGDSEEEAPIYDEEAKRWARYAAPPSAEEEEAREFGPEFRQQARKSVAFQELTRPYLTPDDKLDIRKVVRELGAVGAREYLENLGVANASSVVESVTKTVPYTDSRGNFELDKAIREVGVADAEKLLASLNVPGASTLVRNRSIVLEQQDAAKRELFSHIVTPQIGEAERYDLVGVLASGDRRKLEAAKALFSQQDIDAANKWIEREWRPHGIFLPVGDVKLPWSEKLQRKWHDVTPWKEERGETFGSSLSGFVRGAVPSSLLGLPVASIAVGTAAIPTPIDDVILWALVGGTTAASIVAQARRGGEKPDVPPAFSKAAPRTPKLTTDDVVLVENSRVETLTEALAKSSASQFVLTPAGAVPSLWPRPTTQLSIPREGFDVRGGAERYPIVDHLPPIQAPPLLKFTHLQPGEIEQIARGALENWREPVVFLPGTQRAIPKSVIEAGKKSLQEAAGLLAIASRVAVMPVTREQHEAMQQVFRDIDAGVKRSRWEEVEKALSRSSPLTPAVGANIRRVYEEYLRRKAALDAARKSFIESLNPTPIKGAATPADVDAYAAFLLARALGLPKPAGATFNDTALAQAALLSQAVRNRVMSKVDAATRAIVATGATPTTEQVTQLRAALLQEVSTVAKTTGVAEADLQTQAELGLGLTASPALATTTATAAMSVPALSAPSASALRGTARVGVYSAPIAAAATTTAAGSLVPVGGVPLPPPLLTGTQQESSVSSIIPNGSITWRQGSVWKYIPPPWDQPKPLTSRRAPRGAVKTGGRTPAETIQMIGRPRSRVPSRVSVDLGVADIEILNRGRRIRYTGKGETTNVGTNMLSNTQGMSLNGEVPATLKRRGFDRTLATKSTERRTVYKVGRKTVKAGASTTKSRGKDRWLGGEGFSIGELTGI